MDDNERINLIRRLFALATAKAEDAAELAAQGQRQDEGSNLRYNDLALRLQSLTAEILLVAEAIGALFQNTGPGGDDTRAIIPRDRR